MTHDDAREIALRLQGKFAEKRESLGISKRELARASGLDPKAITFLERGDRIANLTTAFQIADALGIPLAEEVFEAIEKLDGKGEA